MLGSATSVSASPRWDDDRNPGSKSGIKNVIVLISDGMGYNQVDAADYYEFGKLGKQTYEKFPVVAGMSTFPVGSGYDPAQAWTTFDYVNKGYTDSAPAATAMSSGLKTFDGAIGYVGTSTVDPAKKPVKHAIEYAEELGKATGVVSTVQLSHATPAGFVAHNPSRNNYADIAREMVMTSTVDVIMGAGNPWFDDNGQFKSVANSYNYVGGQDTWNRLVAGIAGNDADGDGDFDPWKLVQTRADFQDLMSGKTPDRVCGVFHAYTTANQGRGGDTKAAPYVGPRNQNVPALAEMTKGALNVLDNDKDGFVLMVEGGAVDWASHANQSGRTIEEQIDFNDAVEATISWVNRNSNWNETIVIVTGDHETGYLTGPGSGQFATGPVWNPLTNFGKYLQPGMEWHSGSHTNSLIPFYAKGAQAEQFTAVAVNVDPVRGNYIDNTDIAKVIITSMK
jgi:alkaline phosphatase